MIAGILFDTGSPYVEEIRKALLGGAYLFTLAGFIEGAWLAGEDTKCQLFNLVKVAIVAILVAGFPTAIQQGDEALASLHTSITQGQQQQDAFQQQCAAFAQEPSWSDVAGRLCYTLGRCLQSIGWLGYQIVYWAKDISILLLTAVSPLLLGFLAFSYTRSIGINFLVTSFTVVLWNIGFALVETLLIVLGNIIMPVMGAGAVGAGAAVAGAVTVGPQFVIMCLAAAVLPIIMYLSVPIITGVIMRGGHVAGGAMAALFMANQTGHMMHGMAGGVSAGGDTGGYTNSSPLSFEYPSSSDTGGGSEGNTQSGSSFNSPDGGGSNGAAKSSPYVNSGSISTGLRAPAGTTMMAPDSSMIATQSSDGMILVTDDQGKSSTRPGNINDSVTLDAAFNAHEAAPFLIP